VSSDESAKMLEQVKILILSSGQLSRAQDRMKKNETAVGGYPPVGSPAKGRRRGAVSYNSHALRGTTKH